MPTPNPTAQLAAMRFIWTSLFRSRAYNRAKADERLLIEIRFALARTLRAKRRSLKITQAQLAKRIGAAPATVSRIELAAPDVAIDNFVRAMIALGPPTSEIAAAFDADSREDVQRLRRRIGPRTRRPPSPADHPNIRRRRTLKPPCVDSASV